MATKEKVSIKSRYTGKPQEEVIYYELIRSIRLQPGQISVIVHSDLSISIVANKHMNIKEINDIICMQYNEIQKEIQRAKSKQINREG